MNQQIDLFEERNAAAVRCTVCGLRDAQAGVDVCRRCVERPEEAMTQIDLMLASFAARQRQAARRAQDAWDALSDEERQRWGAFQEALARQQAGEELPDAIKRRLAVTLKAYADQDLRTLTWGLLAMDTAQRLLDHANADLAEAQRRRDRKLAALRAACGVHPDGL